MKPILSIEITAEEGYVKPDLVGGKALLEALRSGKYNKGRGQLCRVDKDHPEDESLNRYCCLGVECKINDLLFIHDGEMIALMPNDSTRENTGKDHLVLPEDHPWTHDFSDSLTFPPQVTVNAFINGVICGDKKRHITEINDFCQMYYESGYPYDAEFSFNTIAWVIDTIWNCI